jgi:hypothetical protein
MMKYIPLIMFAGFVAFIVMLYLRGKRIERSMANFYRDRSLFTTANEPPKVRESLVASENLYCCPAKLTLQAGSILEFYWWEWYLKANIMINGVMTATYESYLAASFDPNTVSEEFIKKTMQLATQSHAGIWRKIKGLFVLKNQAPCRAEKLEDGTFLICWRVLKNRDHLEAEIEWLKNNI